MKNLIKIAVLVATVVAINILSSGFSTYDYSSQCTRCLQQNHIVERQFFKLTYWTKEKRQFAGHDLVPITGTPCRHVFRKGGFGRTIGGLWGGGIACGVTNEGRMFQYRWQALAAAFNLHDRFQNPKLLQESIQVIDSLFPADANEAAYQHAESDGSLLQLNLLGKNLDAAQNPADWATALRLSRKQN